MHGQFPSNLEENLVGNDQSYRLLKFEDIKGKIESTIVAVQDQEISTKPFENKILKEETDRKFRLCKQFEGTVFHLTSGCFILAKNEYVMSLIFVVPCIMLNSEIIPTRCNNCV